MPTGYTAPIYEGKDITVKDYILRCARAFGATIHMRDESLDVEINEVQPSTYHLDMIEKKKKELEKYQKMSVEEAQKIADEEYEKGVKQIEESVKKMEVLRERYTNILEEVKKWNPPTPEHVKLKEFAIEQLESSLHFDCHPIYRRVSKWSGEEWLRNKIKQCTEDIEYHSKEWVEEIIRVEKINKWIRELKESFE
jgi:hypothetical protein